MNPIIIIAYDENVRKALVNSLLPFNVPAVPCATFCEAEDLMLIDLFQGIMVDLSSMVKAKGEEKVVACSLTGFFPTLRVKAMGPMIVPMAMAGDARQDKSLGDFLNRTCSGFNPRKLRSHKRRELFVPTILVSGSDEIVEDRGFTLNISWGGLFIVDMNPVRFEMNQVLTLLIPDFQLRLEVVVVWINPWGQRKAPGIGVKFSCIDEVLEQVLSSLLRSNRYSDRDRLLA